MAENVRKKRAIAALLTSKNTREAAKVAGVSERQLYRWLDLPDFQDELKAAERQTIESSIRRLAELTGKAVDTLSLAMSTKGAPLAAQVRAADIVLARLLDLRTMTDLDQRLANIESRLEKVTS